MTSPRAPDPAAGHAWVEIDLDAVVANARAFADRAGCRLLPMLKADAYGLGATSVARALETVDPWGYGVATTGEGAALRRAGISRPILVFTPYASAEETAYHAADLRPTVGDWEALASWSRTGLPFHLEVDTGMSRTGIRWDTGVPADAAAFLLAARESGAWEGAFTHLYAADNDPAVSAEQRARFAEWLDRMGGRPALVHVANSAAGLHGTAPGENLARPGIWLYGAEVGGERGRTVAVLRAPVVAVREVRPGEGVSYDATWIADHRTTVVTLGAGYTDGVPRSLSGRGEVELGGRVMPLVGRVTMDFLMLDAGEGNPAGVRPGDVATIYGRLVTIDRQAELAGTIPYELLTRLGSRVFRRYLREGTFLTDPDGDRSS